MIETVKQNERLYTKRQVEAARRVRIFTSAMGAMAMADIIGQVRSRRVDGIDFTVEDVVRAYEMYGPDLQAVRGKTVKKKVTQVPAKGKIVDSRVTLHIALMFLSGVSFLVGNARQFACSCATGSRERELTGRRRPSRLKDSKL
jgi:hypothetical protein